MFQLPGRVLVPVLVLSLTACASDPDAGLFRAAEIGDTNTVAALLGAGADPNAQSNNGVTALMSAALGGHTETAQALLDADADANERSNQWHDSLN